MTDKCNKCTVIKNKEKFYNLKHKLCIDCFNVDYLKHEIAILKTAKHLNKSEIEIKLILGDLDNLLFNNIQIINNTFLNNIDIYKLEENIRNNNNYIEYNNNFNNYKLIQLFRLVKTAIYFEKSVIDIKNIINNIIDNIFYEKKENNKANDMIIYNWYNKTYPKREFINSIYN